MTFHLRRERGEILDAPCFPPSIKETPGMCLGSDCNTKKASKIASLFYVDLKFFGSAALYNVSITPYY